MGDLKSSKRLICHLQKGTQFWRPPWWCNGEAPTCQCRGHGFGPWSCRSHVQQSQVSLCNPTTEPELGACEQRPRSPCATTAEACTLQSPCSSTRATAVKSLWTTSREHFLLAATRKPTHTAKINK